MANQAWQSFQQGNTQPISQPQTWQEFNQPQQVSQPQPKQPTPAQKFIAQAKSLFEQRKPIAKEVAKQGKEFAKQTAKDVGNVFLAPFKDVSAYIKVQRDPKAKKEYKTLKEEKASSEKFTELFSKYGGQTKEQKESSERGSLFGMGFTQAAGNLDIPNVGLTIKYLIGFKNRKSVSVVEKILPKVKDGENTPGEIIGGVINSGQEKTAEGKAFIRTAVQAQKQQQNIVIDKQVTAKITIRKTDDLISHEGAPDKRQVDIYREEIRAGGRPSLTVIPEGNKFGVEDGKHKLAAYKQLGITEVPTVEKSITKPKPVEVKPKVVEVPREQLPVGEGKEKVSRLEARMQGVVGKATPEEIDQLGLTTYKTGQEPERLAKAAKYVLENPDDAMRVLKGEIPPPPGNQSNDIFVAMTQHPELTQDLANKLATLKSTAMGQNIGILKNIDPNNPVAIASDIYKIKEAVFEKRYGGKTIKEVTDKYVEKGRMKMAPPKLNDWASVIKKVRC